MAISYDGLWKVLNERGISKTEFRKLINISTVTLAKMSKNEPVSMSIIEDICLTFHCQIEEIMKIESKQQEGKWERIQERSVYSARLFYLTDERGSETRVDFLYGHSILADEGMEGRKRWDLSEYMRRGNLRIWEISSTVLGSVLRTLICAMEQNKKLGEFFGDVSAEFHDNLRNKSKENWRDCFFNAQITHSGKDYRPEIVLIPEQESGSLVKGMQPLHAFGEEPLISESLVCRHKRKLYLDENESPDMNKMELIHDFYKQEGFLINGIRDLCRIGDFEVFSALVEHARQEELFRIESLVEEPDRSRKVLKGFQITVFCRHLSGSYLLGVNTYNAGNPTSWKMYDILVDGQDVVRTVEFAECSASALVCIWEKKEEKRIQLIGYEQIAVMRDICLNLHVLEQTATLEDKYTKKLQQSKGGKNKNPVNRDVTVYSSIETHIGDEGNDPWRRAFEQVEKDFGELYGAETAESRFFAQGMEGHEEFLGWLKKKLSSGSVKSAWIFDPFIDADSVTRMIRSLTDTGVKMNIVTDANAPSKNQQDRIGLLRNVCGQLGELMGSRLAFYAFQASKCLLHDRILLLFHQSYIPAVYNMSNSLDNMGMHTPSVVCRLSRDSAKACAEYYLDLYQRQQEEGKVEVLWEMETGRSSLVQIPPEEEREMYLQELAAFFSEKLAKRGLSGLSYEKKGGIVFPDVAKTEKKNILKTLCEDAGSHWEKLCYLCANLGFPFSSELKRQLEDSYDTKLGEQLQKELTKELNRESAGQKAGQGALKVYPEQRFREILLQTGYLLDNPHDACLDYRVPFERRMALQLFIGKDFPRYRSVVDELEQKEGSWQALKQKRWVIGRLACMMAERTDCAEQLAEQCLESENRQLLAVGMQWFIKHRKLEPAASMVKDDALCHEFFRAMVIDLQIEDCRKAYRSRNDARPKPLQTEDTEKARNEFLEKMQEVKEAWVKHFSDALMAEALEQEDYFGELGTRSVEDVCDLAVMLCKAGKLSVSELETFLTDCFLEKLEKDYKKEDGYWRLEDFQNGELFLSALKEAGTPEGGKRVAEKLASWEKKLVRVLHDVFLHNKNYTKWKCCIDMLIWCCAMRMLCRQLWEAYPDWLTEDRNAPTRQKEIQGLLKKYEVTLQEYSEAYRILCNALQTGPLYFE